MVSFNPFFRPSIEECLEHPYFNRVRRINTEIVSENYIEIELDKVEVELSIAELQ